MYSYTHVSEIVNLFVLGWKVFSYKSCICTTTENKFWNQKVCFNPHFTDCLIFVFAHVILLLYGSVSSSLKWSFFAKDIPHTRYLENSIPLHSFPYGMLSESIESVVPVKKCIMGFPLGSLWHYPQRIICQPTSITRGQRHLRPLWKRWLSVWGF